MHLLMCATAYVTTTLLRINDVKDVLVQRFMLKETRRYQSNGLYASLANCLSHASEIAMSI